MPRPPDASRRRRCHPTGCLLLLLIAPTAVAAADFRLSAGEAFSDAGRVGDVPVAQISLPIISPDGHHVVYVHDAETDGAYELWRVAVHGGTPQRISALLPAGEHVDSYRFSADGATVVYRARQDSLTTLDLYAAPLAGPPGSWVKVNAPLANGQRVGKHTVSPASDLVAYATCTDANSCSQLWVAALDGSEQLNVYSQPSGRTLVGHTVATSFSHFVYLEEDQNGRRELWALATIGPPAVKLNGLLTAGGNVTQWHIAFESDRVVYVADQQTDEVYELYGVPIAGGAATKLNASLVTGGDVSLSPWPQLTPDGSRVLYVADRLVDERHELWSVPVTGGASSRVSPTLPGAGADWDVLDHRVTIDGQLAVIHFRSRDCPACTLVSHLWSAPLGGGAPRRLDGCDSTQENVLGGAVLSPTDPRQLFYIADQEVNARYDLYLGDTCVLCDGFEAGDLGRWSSAVP